MYGSKPQKKQVTLNGETFHLLFNPNTQRYDWKNIQRVIEGVEKPTPLRQFKPGGKRRGVIPDFSLDA